ncbi:hypothetical protein MCOR13_011328 [Pyricularia oryzae]|nr:hypothetical protein MCOR13_011328 [Pyricularia oryzae]
MMGLESQDTLIAGECSRSTKCQAISGVEKVLNPRSASTPAASVSLPAISPVPLVHPIAAPHKLKKSCHPSDDHLLSRASRLILDSAYSPSWPKEPWFGDSGRRM